MHRFLVRRVNGEAISVEAPRAHAGATSHNRLDSTRNKRKNKYIASLRDQLEESIVACIDPTALQLLVDKCVAQHVHGKTARVVKSAEERIQWLKRIPCGGGSDCDDGDLSCCLSFQPPHPWRWAELRACCGKKHGNSISEEE
jgi:hypothetical protein